MSVFVKQAGTWHEIPSGGGKPQPGVGSPAGITAVTGAPVESTYTDAKGVKHKVWQFNANGTITATTAGLVRLLVVGGGGGGAMAGGGNHTGGGGGSAVVDDAFWVVPGTYQVTVGTGGSGIQQDRGNNAGSGGGSAVFTFFNGGGGGGGGAWNGGFLHPPTGNGGSGPGGHGGSSGVSSDITGTNVAYGQGGGSGSTSPGSGGWMGSNGLAGAVIISVETS